MLFQGVTFAGPAIDDRETFERLPSDVQQFLVEDANGLVAYGGGLHVRGACHEPTWHSLRASWTGPAAFYERYVSVDAADVPFAEDAVGDQWLLRGGKVLRLFAETGQLEATSMIFTEFLAAVERAPIATLGLEPLLQFQSDGGRLEPGQLLSVYPPFCTVQSGAGVSLRAISAGDRLGFLADFARQLPADGARVRVVAR